MKIIRCMPASDSGFCQPEIISVIEDREAVLMTLGLESTTVSRYQARVVNAAIAWLESDMTADISECYRSVRG